VRAEGRRESDIKEIDDYEKGRVREFEIKRKRGGKEGGGWKGRRINVR
jgi:hypothetical protein